MQALGLNYTFTVVSIAAATHWVAYRWALDAFPRLLPHKRWLVAYCGAIVLAQPVTRALTNLAHSDLAARVHVYVLLEILMVAIAAIPIGAMRAARFVQKKLTGRKGVRRDDSRPLPSLSSLPVNPISRRDAIERVAGVGFLAGAGSMLGWGMIRGRHEYAMEQLVVRIPGLPRALDGYTIAQISDVHAGPFVDERQLAEGLVRVREARADLLVATGDLIDFDAGWCDVLARRLADLAPRDGVAAILGNHDYYTGAAKVLAAMRAAGVRMLVNDGTVIRPNDGGGFALLGVDDLWSPRVGGEGPRLDRAIAAVPADRPRVLLSHQPPSIDDWPGQVALQLSGHTHGGQINPGFRPAAVFMRYLAGRYDVGGTTLYVNRGFGTAGPPSRVGAPPEVTRIVLVSA